MSRTMSYVLRSEEGFESQTHGQREKVDVVVVDMACVEEHCASINIDTSASSNADDLRPKHLALIAQLSLSVL